MSNIPDEKKKAEIYNLVKNYDLNKKLESLTTKTELKTE